MVKGLYTANWGMINEQKRVDILANNMANAATTGYKKEGSTSEAFKDIMAYKINDTSEPWGAKKLNYMNMGVKIGEVYTDYSQGPIHETGNTFDMALSGEGFFSVEFTNKSGKAMEKFTRDGNFTLNLNGEVVNKNGDYLLDDKGSHIKLDPIKQYSIDRNGMIYDLEGNAQAKIKVTEVVNTDYLEKYGENYYTPLEGMQTRESTTQVISTYLEDSNVQVVSEMVDLINFTRQYEANQKALQANDSLLEKAVNDIGKV